MTEIIEENVDKREAKTAYSYHSDTGEYLGTELADPDPLDMSNWLYPAYTTSVTPPKEKADKALVWDGNGWIYVDDCRGQVWFTDGGSEVPIDFIGKPEDQCLLKEKPTLPPPPLAEFKSELKFQIDVFAERERIKYITDGVGQAMTYQEKIDQAIEYSKALSAYRAAPKTTPPPTEVAYPLLIAGLSVDGDNLEEVAETVTFAYACWQQIGGVIEGIRLRAKAEIDAADSHETAQKIYDELNWPKVD